MKAKRSPSSAPAAGLTLAKFLLLLAASTPGFGALPQQWIADESRQHQRWTTTMTTRSVAVPSRKLLLHKQGDARPDGGPAPSFPDQSTAGSRSDLNNASGDVANPTRIGFACSRDDVAVYQSPTDKLPNGIPTYTVRVMNVCASGCAVSGVHVSCGWYSSARLVNPKVFRRLRFDDCLVNDGRPIPVGGGLVFTYANTYRYPLSVTALSCDTDT